MAGGHEGVLDGVLALHVAALPAADVSRNRPKATEVGPGGLVVIHDGDPGEPEIYLSPLSYTWSRRVVIDVAAFESPTQTREQVLAGIFAAIRVRIEADRTLGGLCEWIEPEAPVTNDAQTQGTEAIRWAQFGLVCVYTTSSPLT